MGILLSLFPGVNPFLFGLFPTCGSGGNTVQYNGLRGADAVSRARRKDDHGFVPIPPTNSG